MEHGDDFRRAQGEPPRNSGVRGWKEFWDAYAEAFAQPLQNDGLLSAFVMNPNVTGLYAEAWVRSMARRMLGHRFRISTGAVIRSSDSTGKLKDVPQCDLIIWDPSEMPAIFECAEFALVPHFSVRAIIEVKRKVSNPEDLATQLKDRQARLDNYGPVLGVVVSHTKPLFPNGKCRERWLEDYIWKPGMYVHDRQPMTRLLDTNNKPDTDGIMVFIYFLAQVVAYTSAGKVSQEEEERL